MLWAGGFYRLLVGFEQISDHLPEDMDVHKKAILLPISNYEREMRTIQ